jgi:hypothetical protein
MTDAPDLTTGIEQESVIPPATARRQGSFVLPVLGGVTAAVFGFGIAQVVPNGWPTADTATLQTQLATQSQEIQNLSIKLSQISKAAVIPTDNVLSDRVSALESGLLGRVDALDQKVATLSVAPPKEASINQSALTKLQSEVDQIKSGGLPAIDLTQVTAAIDAKLAEADAKIAAIKSDAELIAKTAAQRAAVHQLLAALESGAPYSSALTDLSEIILPPVLSDNAQSGLPSLQSLRATFPDAARAALDASLRAEMGQSWTERIGTFLRGQTGARSLEPREGNDPDAVLSRAEAALATGDVTAVIAELDGLPAEGKAAMGDWTSRAKTRETANAAVQDLLAAAKL